ncbi:AMP-dependent synthetase and ligase [Paenibacillus arenosi]|uniref:AMP-dependent synthetase and ligase n=1 Tax=Paenibacillus arenosi TaxID=2774142 RepID=A0ABR9B129_9BACL|nr:AMP-dependent synthetase and ligase [Paenibacillus arenosi]MBD8499160.1 AMP-dependent synthetase and ligase [Paenibacillus arenosi]
MTHTNTYQIEQLAQQLIQQTNAATQKYQQLLQQEQQNAARLQELAKIEQHAANVIQTALQGHQTAIQQLQQIIHLAHQAHAASSGYPSTGLVAHVQPQVNYIHHSVPNVNSTSYTSDYRGY